MAAETLWTIRLDEGMRERLRVAAKREQRTMASLVRYLIDRGLDDLDVAASMRRR